MARLGIVILATNAYFVLGLRFIRRFKHFYKGDMDLTFYFFSDIDPNEYISEDLNVIYHPTYHDNWRDGTNSKFKNILSLKDEDIDYIYYFDADTNIQWEFTEEWMIGNLVGGEHYGNRSYLKDGKGFDRNPIGHSYVPLNSKHPYTYCYGAFFGGKKENVMEMMTTLYEWQQKDQARGYEPPVNDESYINKYFHYNDAHIIPTEKFNFVVSDKGGLENTRFVNLDIEDLKENIKLYKEKLWDIQHRNFIYNDKTNLVG